jgi:hypothetical protein
MDMHNSCVLVNEMKLKVDLTKYAERHQFNFDESLDEYVSNDQVRQQNAAGGQVRVVPCQLCHASCRSAAAQCSSQGCCTNAAAGAFFLKSHSSNLMKA